MKNYFISLKMAFFPTNALYESRIIEYLLNNVSQNITCNINLLT